MLKKTLLSTLLLLSNIAAAQIKIDFDLTIENQETTRTVTCDAILEENTIGSLVNDDLIFDIVAQKDGDIITIQANLYEKSEENGVVLVATLKTDTQLNQPATVIAGERSADEDYNMITFVVTPSQVE